MRIQTQNQSRTTVKPAELSAEEVAGRTAAELAMTLGILTCVGLVALATHGESLARAVGVL